MVHEVSCCFAASLYEAVMIWYRLSWSGCFLPALDSGETGDKKKLLLNR